MARMGLSDPPRRPQYFHPPWREGGMSFLSSQSYFSLKGDDSLGKCFHPLIVNACRILHEIMCRRHPNAVQGRSFL
jgi:hypothetical protein